MAEHVTICPHCNYRGTNNGLTKDSTFEPTNGDLALCIRCGRWGVYQGTNLRQPTAVEAAEIAADPYYQDVERAWADMAEVNGLPRWRN